MSLRAIDILTDDPNRIVPILSRIWPVAGGASFGFGVCMFMNVVTRRPVFSGIQYHIGAAAAGAFAGKTVDGWRNEHMAERDAILKRYVETHPEDFPDIKRVKYAEVLQPWVPIR